MRCARVLISAGCVVAVLGIGFTCMRQQSTRREDPDEPHSDGTHTGLSEAQQRELERIATLGYVSGVEPVPQKTGVLTHDPGAALAGLTLYTTGEGPRAVLIDMEGNVVHSWSFPGSKYWARARVLPKGDLLAITCGPPRLLKLNHDSQLLWRYDGHAHHDFAVLPDSTICVLVRGSTSRPHLQAGAPLIDDNVLMLDRHGHELASISLLKAFERSEFGARWLTDHPLPDDPDIFHTNSLEPLSREGRMQLLLSIRSIGTLATLDVASGKIVAARAGRWHKQHEARRVGDHLLLFDNLGMTKDANGLEQSRVIELDMGTGELIWSFSEPGFFSRGAGAQQRLSNGNTLITESENGRILEVTRDGRIVWEYMNPATVEGRPDLIVGILRAERLPADFASKWGSGPTAGLK